MVNDIITLFNRIFSKKNATRFVTYCSKSNLPDSVHIYCNNRIHDVLDNTNLIAHVMCIILMFTFPLFFIYGSVWLYYAIPQILIIKGLFYTEKYNFGREIGPVDAAVLCICIAIYILLIIVAFDL